MLIDIDIKIEDSDGNLLNCFEKQFQEETDCLIRPENSVNFGKSFEDFLSEYLSESGHIVRNKLLYNCTGCSDTPDLCESSAEDAASDNASATNFESGEMEYKNTDWQAFCHLRQNPLSVIGCPGQNDV